MSTEPDNDFATFLVGGKTLTAEELVPVVYGELRRMAQAMFRREGAHHTLQPTALVNEAYLRLAKQDKDDWTNRAQFLANPARCMRRVLVDAARKRNAEKRPNELRRVTLIDPAQGATDSELLEVDLVELDRALNRLGEVKPRYLEHVELRFFGGLSIAETASFLNISPASVVRRWRRARAWLFDALGPAN